MLNTFTASIKDQVLSGFAKKGGIEAFVGDLIDNNPPATAGLLARTMPPAAPEPSSQDRVDTVNIFSIPHGSSFRSTANWSLETKRAPSAGLCSSTQ